MPETSHPYFGLLQTASVPDLGPGPRPEVDGVAEVTASVGEAGRHHPLAAPRLELVRALALLWHDHLDAAHEIAQGIETADGSYVHALVHRREPDYSNSKYWFRRVGTHPCYALLADRARSLLNADSEPALMTKGKWDPFAFVDACEEAERGTAREQEVLKKIQAIEFELFLGYLVK